LLRRRQPTLFEKSIPYIGAAVAVGAAVGAYVYFSKRRSLSPVSKLRTTMPSMSRRHAAEVPVVQNDNNSASETLPLAET
jgi:hypothetical protein